MKILLATWIAAVLLPAVQAQPIAALQLNDRGNRASESGRYEEAIPLYRQSVALWEQAGPEYDAHRATTLLNLGVAVAGAGNRAESARILKEALDLNRATLGKGNLRTVTNMNLLAGEYLIVGRLDDAEALFREALPLARAIDPAGVQTARALGGLSSALVRRGHAKDAIAPADEALKIDIQATGNDSLETALAFTYAAEAQRVAGHPERALPLLRRGRAIYEKTLGPDHPRVALLLSQEGMLMLGERKPATAEDLLTRALDSLERSCPKCTAERAIAENNLAILRFRQGRFGEAGDLLTHAVTLREGFTAAPGAELAGTLNLLALVREKQKRYQDAERLKQRATAILAYH